MHLFLPLETRKREVYTDESHIHENYHRNDDSIWVRMTIKMYKPPRTYIKADIAFALLFKEQVLGFFILLVLRTRLDWYRKPFGISAHRRKGDHKGDCHKVFHGEN
jgi:hypothetical protein